MVSYAEIERRWKKYGVCAKSYTGMYCKTNGTWGQSRCNIHVQQKPGDLTILAGVSRFSLMAVEGVVLWHHTKNPEQQEELFLLFET